MRRVRAKGLFVCTTSLVCCVVGTAFGQASNGPDVIVGELPDISNYSPAAVDAGFDAFAVGTTSCNRGNANLNWWTPNNTSPSISYENRHPAIGQNLFRLNNGRFEQIGVAFLKHGFTALQGSECAGDAGFPHASCTNANMGGGMLGIGCSDPYNSGLNGGQAGMGPKWQVNASKGLFPYPFESTMHPYSGTQTNRRLRARTADMNTTTYPSASTRYFVEGYYSCGDDSDFSTGGVSNKHNSASWREVTIAGGPTDFSMAFATGSSTRREEAGIYAWKAADAAVVVATADAANDGRFLVGARVTGPVGGVYTYEYAVQNLNSHRSGASFSVPYPGGTSVSNIGFHDVEYHTGEPNAVNANNPSIDDWAASAGASSITWSGPAYNGTPPVYNMDTVAYRVLSFVAGTGNDHWANSLRWGSLFNFRFQTTVAPATGAVQVALWRPGGVSDPKVLTFAVPTPGGSTSGAVNTGPCCNGTTCTLTTQAACTGSFGAIGTLCTPNPCVPFPTGACCISGVCKISPLTTCQGLYMGDGVSCTPNPCPSTGACCVGASCSITASTSCSGTYLGNNTTCTGTPCATGACCNGTTCSILTSAQCTAGGGAYQGNNSLCSPNPCTALSNDNCGGATPLCDNVTVQGTTVGGTTEGGASCVAASTFNDRWYSYRPTANASVTIATLSGGTLTDTTLSVFSGCGGTELACDDDSGPGTLSLISNFAMTANTTYLIRVARWNTATDGTFIISVTGGAACAVTGSCCIGSGCTTTTQAGCTGAWTNGGSCTPNPCGILAACCNGTGCSLTTQGACSLTWIGTSGTCSPNPCLPSNDLCENRPGIPLGTTPFNSTYATTDGIAHNPTCLFFSNDQIYNDLWFNYPSTFTGTLRIDTCGSSFDTKIAVYNGYGCLDYATRLIACDDDNPTVCGTGSLQSSVTVNVTNGQFLTIRVGSFSATVTGVGQLNLTGTPIVTGACCAADGGCTTTAPGSCATGYQGDGTTCSPNPCPQPTGACCATDGNCTTTTQAACTGTYQGNGSSCTPNPCPQPTGACCAADGNCTTTTQAACTGTYQGNGSSCTPNPCPQPTGACCAADGNCTTTTQAACTGTYQGNGSSCMPNPCPQPQGACCNGSACSFGTAAQCSGAYQGNNTACGPVGNPTTCCPANFNLTAGLSVQDIFDFLSAYFGGSPSADFNGVGGLSVQDIFDFLEAYFTGCPG